MHPIHPVSASLTRGTLETAQAPNRFAAALAEKALVIHAEQGGKLIGLCKEILAWGKPLFTLESEYNRALLALGAQVYREA